MSQTLSPSLARWAWRALWASISARMPSTSSASIGAAQSCCGRNGHAARVEVLARQRLSLSQGHAAEYERPSSWPRRRMLGRGTGRAYPPAHSRLPPSRRGLPQVMGAVALCWRSHEPPSCATGDAREWPARAASRWTHRDQATQWDDHHRQGQRNVGNRHDADDHHPGGPSQCLRCRGTRQLGSRRHSCIAVGQSLRGPGAGPPGVHRCFGAIVPGVARG